MQIVDTTFGPYYRTDFTMAPEGEVVMAYIEGNYVSVKLIGRVERNGN